MQVLLDTNILVRWINHSDRDHSSTFGAVEELRRLRHVPVVVPQCLYEYWVVATRPAEQNGYGLGQAEANRRLDRFGPPTFATLHDERAILPEWRRLVTRYDVKGKSAHDARLVAAMVRHGVTHLLTWNSRHFSRYREIVALTPDEVLDGALR